MTGDEHRFYDDYEPAENVEKSLNDPAKDYTLSAPYRDILGVLESEECWNREDSIKAKTILEKIEEWDENERERTETPPSGTKNVRIRCKKLDRQKNLVNIIRSEGKANFYWKVPDEETSHPIIRQISVYIDNFVSLLDTLLYQHDLLKIAVAGFVIGSLVNLVHPSGLSIMSVSIVLFSIGHILAYRDEPLTE